MAISTAPVQVPPAAANCWQCRHFASSWDPKLPYLCRFMGFKSRNLPSMDVLRMDGTACMGFSAKTAASSTRTATAAHMSEMRRT